MIKGIPGRTEQNLIFRCQTLVLKLLLVIIAKIPYITYKKNKMKFVF